MYWDSRGELEEEPKIVDTLKKFRSRVNLPI
jgi:hypothetical protein